VKRVIVAGKLNVDIFYYVNSVEMNSNNVASESIVELGGKASNVAVALKKLGMEVLITGCVGNDMFGDFIREKLKNFGVNTDYLKECGKDSGRTAIVVTSDGQNTMFNYPGANQNFTVEMIDWTIVEEGDALFIQFGIPAETVFELASMAKRAGMIVYVDPSYPSEIPWDAFYYFDYIAPNERELQQISGKKEQEKAAKYLLKKGAESVIVKMGESGARIFLEKKVLDIPSFKTNAVDTTGAGDSFNAAFIYGRLRGLDDEESGKLASLAASITVSRRGTTSSFPSIEELRKKAVEAGLRL
jgi:ribokinase